MQWKNLAPCQKELKVEVPMAVVDSEFDVVYQNLQRVARVPGFRVGKAPRDLLERYHGPKAREEVLRRLIDRSLGEALGQQKSLDLVGRPQITEVQFEPKQPLTYSAVVEIAPEVPLGRYKGISLTASKTEVSAETAAQVMKQLRDQQAQLKPVMDPRPAAVGDFILADLTEQARGRPPVVRRDVVVSLDLEKDPEGILKQIVGASPGEKRVVPLKDGMTVTIDVKQIKVKELPALDDAFAKSVGPYETLGALESEVRQGLEKQAAESRRRSLENQAVEHLLEKWNFDVPPSLVASHARRLLKQRAVELMSQGVASDQVQERSQILAEQAKLDALKTVKIFFILRRIAAEEKMTVTPSEMDERIGTIAARLQKTPEDVRADLESRELMEEAAWGILRKKVVDWIVQEAQVSEVSAGEKK